MADGRIREASQRAVQSNGYDDNFTQWRWMEVTNEYVCMTFIPEYVI